MTLLEKVLRDLEAEYGRDGHSALFTELRGFLAVYEETREEKVETKPEIEEPHLQKDDTEPETGEQLPPRTTFFSPVAGRAGSVRVSVQAARNLPLPPATAV